MQPIGVGGDGFVVDGDGDGDGEGEGEGGEYGVVGVGFNETR